MKVRLLLFISLIFIFFGCSSTEPSLQNLDFFGNAHKSTIKLTKDEKAGDLTIRGSFAFNGKKELSTQVSDHSLVNENGVFEVEPVEGEDYYTEYSDVNIYEFAGNNFHWKLPEVQSMLELEYNVSPTVAIYGGGSYSNIDNHDFYGYSLGIGFFKEKETWAYRFDIGGKLNETLVYADYIRAEDVDLSEKGSRKVYFFESKKKEKFINMNFGFTVNTRKSEWPVNIFLNYTLGWQRFYDFNPDPATVTDLFNYYFENFEYSENYHSFSAGLFKDIEGFGKIIGGARFTKYTDDKGGLETPDYFIQFDLDLF